VTDGSSERHALGTPPRGTGRARTAELRAVEAAAPRDALDAAPRPSGEELEVLLRVGEMLRRLRFGTVLLVVQDGKVVQIEMAEKIRL
jgi:hypothetical protein